MRLLNKSGQKLRRSLSTNLKKSKTELLIWSIFSLYYSSLMLNIPLEKVNLVTLSITA